MTPSAHEPLSRRAFRALLRAFPRAFRTRYGREMLAAFDAEREARRGTGRLRRTAWALGTLGDALVSALKERGAERRAGPGAVDTSRLALRVAARNMMRAPGITLAILVTLGLGVGVTAMMYGVADRLLLRPPEGVVDAGRVVRIYFDRTSFFTHERRTDGAFSYPDLVDFEGLAAFQSVAGYSNEERTFGSGAEAQRIRVQLAGAALFPLLGVRPAVGRFYGEEEDRAEGGSAVVVLGHAFWARRFAGDPAVLGRELEIGRGRYTVVGVAPRGFTGSSIQPVDAWLPLQVAKAAEGRPGWQTSRGWLWFGAVARLAPGVSREGAEAAATAVHRAAHERMVALGSYDPDARVVLYPIVAGDAPNAGPEIGVARWLTGLAALVLLIACANVANLMLLRSVRRRREFAIRIALGVGRRTLRLQILVESALYAVIALAVASLLARWGGALAYRVLLPKLDPGVVFDSPRFLVVAALTTAVAGAVSVFLPLELASRRDVMRDLKESGRGRSSTRLRSGLSVLQVSLSVVLLVGAGLFLRSLDRVRSLDLGFSPANVLLASVETSGGAHSEAATRAVTETAARLAGAAGIQSVATSLVAPLSGWYRLPLLTAGGDSVHLREGPYFNVVSPAYVDVMGMHLRRGRGLLPADTVAGAPPVMLVSEELSRQVFAGQDPLGRCLRVTLEGVAVPPCTRVVGVVADHRFRAFEEPAAPMYYLPTGHPAAPGVWLLAVRSGGGMRRTADVVRASLLGSGSDVRYVSVQPLKARVEELSRSWTLGAVLLLVFGGLALVVASLGLYAVLAFETAERDFEFGLRSALGASPRGIAGMILRAALSRVALGTGIGFAVVAVFAAQLRGLLFRTSPVDPLVLGLTGALMTAVAVLATLRPAVRAARAGSTVALRADG